MKTKKQKKRKISVSFTYYQNSWRDGPRFWMQIPAAEVARGLRERVSACNRIIFSEKIENWKKEETQKTKKHKKCQISVLVAQYQKS